MKSIVIEIFGICGSGKSYMANNIRTMLYENDISVYDRNDLYKMKNLHGVKKIWSGIKLLLTPYFSVLYIDVLFSHHSNAEKRASFRYLTKILLQQQYLLKRIKNNTSAIYLIDEGFTQLMFALNENSTLDAKRRKKIMWFFRKLFSCYDGSDLLLLCIDGNVETSYQRIETREQGGPTGYKIQTNKESKYQYLSHILKVYNSMNSLLPHDTKIRHITSKYEKYDIESIYYWIIEQYKESRERN